VLIEAGGIVALIEQHSARVELAAYFPIGDGRKLRPGMVANVSPQSVERDLYGSIRAAVTQVSELPETEVAVTARVGIPSLAKQFMASGPPIAVTIALDRDPSTPSGFRWTSSRGPDLKITAGETAAVTVVVEEKRPIDLVMPLFDAWLH
jgi:HlyD family secretion protein